MAGKKVKPILAIEVIRNMLPILSDKEIDTECLYGKGIDINGEMKKITACKSNGKITFFIE